MPPYMLNQSIEIRLQQASEELAASLTHAEQMNFLDSVVLSTLAEQRDNLQHLLVQIHKGDEDAAFDDDRYDELFARAGLVLKPRPKPKASKKKHTGHLGIHSENGGIIVKR
jgi:hypothetical protein